MDISRISGRSFCVADVLLMLVAVHVLQPNRQQPQFAVASSNGDESAEKDVECVICRDPVKHERRPMFAPCADPLPDPTPCPPGKTEGENHMCMTLAWRNDNNGVSYWRDCAPTDWIFRSTTPDKTGEMKHFCRTPAGCNNRHVTLNPPPPREGLTEETATCGASSSFLFAPPSALVQHVTLTLVALLVSVGGGGVLLTLYS